MTTGSSQGLPHSGAVAILCFLHAIDELNGAMLSRPSFKAAHGIHHYQRAIDNMLFVTDEFWDHVELTKMLNDQISPYSVKIEESSDSEVSFFDFKLVLPEGPTRRIGFKPTLRDNGPVLSIFSQHQSSIHLSWPIAYVRRLYKLSSSIAHFRVAREEFLSRLRQQAVPDVILTHILNCSNYFTMSSCTIPRTKITNGLFVVMPFHPVWLKCISRAVHSFHARQETKDLLNDSFNDIVDFKIAVSWKQQCVPLRTSLVQW